MTYPALEGWGTPSFVDATNLVLQRDVHPLLLEVLRRDPTLIGRFKTGKAATNRKVEWFERDWVPFQFTTNSDITNDTTDLTLTPIETGVQKWFAPGDIVQCVGDTGGVNAPQSELFQVVSSTVGGTIVLDREYGGTTHAGAITTAGLIFEKISPNLTENSSPREDQSRGFGPPKVNYTQIFGYDMDVSGSALAMNMYNMSDFYGTNLKELTEELKLNLERASIYGVPRASDPEATAADARRTMGGLRYYLTQSGANYVSTGYTTVTEDLINYMCRKIVNKNGKLDNQRGIIACSPGNAEVIADIWKDKIQINREDTVRGTQVKSIVTKLGFTLDIVWDINIRTSDLFILNTSKIEIAPLQGRAWFVKKYDNGKDGQSSRVIGEWTMRVWDSLKDHAYCDCLTTKYNG
jgi:hypothetical protein